MVLSKPVKTKHINEFNEKKVLILGNGPSLNEALKNKNLMEGKEYIAVNNFPTTAYYELFKPKILVLQAPEFWIDDVDDVYIDFRYKLFDAIVNKTQWKLLLFMPAKYKNAKQFNTTISQNKMVEINYFNDTPIDGFFGFKTFCYDRLLGMPRPHNIMIPAILMAMHLGFKEIYLTGVDHSWVNDLSVDDDNQVLMSHKHFYDCDSVKKVPMNKLGRGTRKMHEVLQKFVYSFAAYHEIEQYANHKKVDIYNTTTNSHIDAFERIKLP